jgi:phenylalanine-4-hydroxylase
MMQPPSAPAGQSLKLRGDYSRAAPDYTVEQQWDDYAPAEHAIWRTLYLRQIELARRYAPPEFLAGLALVGTKADAIPRFADVNRILDEATGWRIVAVPGLIPEEHFFAHLSNRRFPVSVWMREPSELDYLAEPDLFHDFFGHVPLLANPVFARFMQAYGVGGSKAQAHDAVGMLARLYWYTVEFGLVRSGNALKAYGAGILSSKGETVYSVESPAPHRVGFDLERVMRTEYLIDDYQRIYFVLEDFEQLFHAGYDTDFAPIYRQFARTPGIAPGALLPTDRVITRGTQQRNGKAG